ncbi:MAG: hypothetical protein EON90_05690 [Brevundimonas sp.]|nr:MAG: hypothetical protein EON90_05690 [Brevundimonas sp.]
MLHTRDLAGHVEVDGQAFDWSLRRDPQWCTADGWRGMSIALRMVGATREAILEFPMPSSGSNVQPQRQRPEISKRLIENGVRSALECGWEPRSRGKAIIVEVDADGC